jgi:nucleoside-diphosphate-sugar epimerase
MDFVIRKAVITGATGAIGTALLRKLIQEGISVTVLTRPDSPRNDVFPAFPEVKVRICDLSGLSSYEPEPEDQADVFFHLAWMGASGPARHDPEIQSRNITYTLDAVRLAKRLGCHTFIGTGSQAEYGRSDLPLTPETPAFPENAYGAAKLCAGQLSRLLSEKLQIRHIWLRYLSVYGPYDGPNALIPAALRKMFANEPLDLTEGRQIWDYLYSADAGSALLAAAERGRDGAVYVVGSGDAHPLREYLLRMKESTGAESELRFGAVPYSKAQVIHLEADIRALSLDTGWKPETGFEQGILACIEAMKED